MQQCVTHVIGRCETLDFVVFGVEKSSVVSVGSKWAIQGLFDWWAFGRFTQSLWFPVLVGEVLNSVMAERPSIPAVYDTNRAADGKFAKGNTVSAGNATTVHKKLQSLRTMWYDANSLEDMAKVKDELVNLAMNCPIPDVKLRAIVYYLDRTLGKPQENLNLDVSEGGKPAVLPLLSPEELSVLERVVRRTAEPDVVDVEAKQLPANEDEDRGKLRDGT